MSRQGWVQALEPIAIADGTTLASSAALTDVNNVTTSPLVIPANFLILESAYRFTAHGVFSTTGTPNLSLGIYLGGVAGTALVTSGNIVTQSGATNLTWRLVVESVVRSCGASGTIFSEGTLFGVGSGLVAMMPASAPAAVTVNTTVANSLTVGAQWGTSSSSNSLTLHNFIVEALN